MASTTASSSVVGAPQRASGPAVSFPSTLGSEWSKYVTLRSMWISAFLAIVLSTGLTALVSWATAWSFDDWSEADRATFDPITFGAIGSIVSLIVVVVMSVQLVASEYSSGMIRQTMTTTPKRSRVFWAKTLVSIIAIVAITAISAVANFYAAQMIFNIYDVPSASLGDSDVGRFMIGMVATAPTYAIIATVAAFVLRSAAGAITLVLGVIFIPSFFGGLLPSRWQEDVLAYLPTSLADSIAMHHLSPDTLTYADPGRAWIALVAWMVVLCAVGLWRLNRTDV